MVFYQAVFSLAQTGPLEIKEYNDVAYLSEDKTANDSLQRLNLVVPVADDNIPLLIWIGGGAWSYVNRNMEMDLSRKFGQEGIAVASIGHRLSSAIWKDSSMNFGVKHPAHVLDIAAAVKWLYDHATEYGYDQDKLFVGGFSSGAHLAALVAMDNRYLANHNLSTDIFKGVIPISGAYDIVNYYEAFLNGSRPALAETHVQAVFGESQESMIEASPTEYLDSLSTPMLIMSDNNVFNYTNLLEDRLRETEFRQLQIVYAYELAHGDLWRDISKAEKSIYRDLMIHFIEKNKV